METAPLPPEATIPAPPASIAPWRGDGGLPDASVPADAGLQDAPSDAAAEEQGDADAAADVATLPLLIFDAGPPEATLGNVFGPPTSTLCGPNTCNVNEICCNPSCGICTAPGEDCSHEVCTGIQNPVSVYCGMNTCNVGEVCCNPTCGICVRPGETCRQEPCPP
jgi:hypothetical protein